VRQQLFELGCGPNAITRSAVASTMAAQKSKILPGSFLNVPGILVGSGSRPTHSKELFCRSAWRSCSRKVMFQF
jgi:hypothetical protein